MGSRLRIALSDLHGIPGVYVNLRSTKIPAVFADADDTVETSAEVTFQGTDVKLLFDTSTYQGKIELSCDFNWFRYPNDHEHHSRKLLHMLYNYSINFQVSH